MNEEERGMEKVNILLERGRQQTQHWLLSLDQKLVLCHDSSIVFMLSFVLAAAVLHSC